MLSTHIQRRVRHFSSTPPIMVWRQNFLRLQTFCIHGICLCSSMVHMERTSRSLRSCRHLQWRQERIFQQRARTNCSALLPRLLSCSRVQGALLRNAYARRLHSFRRQAPMRSCSPRSMQRVYRWQRRGGNALLLRFSLHRSCAAKSMRFRGSGHLAGNIWERPVWQRLTRQR